MSFDVSCGRKLMKTNSSKMKRGGGLEVINGKRPVMMVLFLVIDFWINKEGMSAIVGDMPSLYEYVCNS